MKFKTLFYNFFRFSPFKKKFDLIIFDDILPSNLSPWRIYEFAELAKFIKNSKIYTDSTTFTNYNLGKSYEENLKLLEIEYPNLKNKIFKFNKRYSNCNTKLAYTLFYNNLVTYFPFFEENNIPFVFTLYPGGGFEFNNDHTDEFLRTIFSSKNFRGVIVNQHVTKTYLLNRNLVDQDKINLVFGVPLRLEASKDYQKPIDKINVVFFANKYTPKGLDKGFDEFQKIALRLSKIANKYRFTVIGNFNETDIDYPELLEITDFKGLLNENAYNQVLKDSHFIISVNKPFILSKGAFDGFPLATCVAAGINNVIMVLSDYFNEAETINLINDIDYIKYENDIDAISLKIHLLSDDFEKMKTIAINGKNKLINLYGYDNQIVPRVEFFKKNIF